MTRLVVIDPESVLSLTGEEDILAVDISGFSDSDFISIALPDYPASSIDEAQTFLDLTSNDEGDFDIGPTDSIAFSNSVTALTDSDCEARFPLSLLANVDRTQISGVRFRVHATTNCTFRALALRVVSADWVQAPIDIDTMYNQARRPVPRDGSLSRASDFPTNNQAGLPTEWPILFRTDDPTSSADPQPIDASIGAFVRTGGLDGATGDANASITVSEGGRITVADSTDFDPNSDFTFEALIKPTDLNNGPMGIVTKFNNSAGQKGYRLGVNTCGQLVFEWTTDGTTVFRFISTGDTRVTVGTWHHVAVTYTPFSAIALYIDGVQVGFIASNPSTGVVAATDRPFVLGAWNTG